MKEGRKTKDAVIADGFNRQKKVRPTRADIRLAKVEKQRLELEKRIQDRELKKIEDRISKVRAEVGELPPPEAEEPLESGSQGDEEDAKSAYKMLQDMRWVYRNVKGRSKLRDLVDGDDKQFVFMVKELMRIEASLLSAKIRKGEDENGQVNQNFFVVLKGLESDKKILEMTDKDVDMKQISRALNPDGTETVE